MPTQKLLPGEWRKSSFSFANGDCAEVALSVDGGLIGVRNSRHTDDGVLWFTKAEWEAFQAGVRDHQFDL